MHSAHCALRAANSNEGTHMSTHPVTQAAMVQVPFVQLVVATYRELSAVHVTPQAPQLLGSSVRWASQPSVATLLQFLYLSCSTQEVWQLVVISTGGEKSGANLTHTDSEPASGGNVCTC
jgi:hypothetical protein